MARSVFLIVLDGFGIGEEPDACLWNEGSNDVCASATNSHFPKFSNFVISQVTRPQGLTCTYVPATVLDHSQATPNETETRRLTLVAA